MQTISLTVAIAATLNANAVTKLTIPLPSTSETTRLAFVSPRVLRKRSQNDAAAAARGYMEFGDYSLEAHTAVRALAKEFLAKPYDSMSGEPMTMAKCIDLVHSQELQAIIKKYQGKGDN